jgi:hypothetical protein
MESIYHVRHQPSPISSEHPHSLDSNHLSPQSPALTSLYLGAKEPIKILAMAVSMLRQFLMPRVRMSIPFSTTKAPSPVKRSFSSTPTPFATYNQVVKVALFKDTQLYIC